MLHYAAMINHEEFVRQVLTTQNIGEINKAVRQKTSQGNAPYRLSNSDKIRNELAWVEKQNTCYHLRTPPYVAIFYMSEGRPGADKECETLSKAFSELGMIPFVARDPNEEDVYRVIRFCQHRHVSALIVAIMCHGDCGVLKLRDKEMQIHNVVQQMNSTELLRIPKVSF